MYTSFTAIEKATKTLVWAHQQEGVTLGQPDTGGVLWRIYFGDCSYKIFSNLPGREHLIVESAWGWWNSVCKASRSTKPPHLSYQGAECHMGPRGVGGSGVRLRNRPREPLLVRTHASKLCYPGKLHLVNQRNLSGPSCTSETKFLYSEEQNASVFLHFHSPYPKGKY